MLNIAIFSPSQNPYSETFIQAHKNNLKGCVFYYYGVGAKIQLEGASKLMPSNIYKVHRIYAKIFKKPSNYLWEQRVLYSLKTNKIDVVLVEYGTHAHHLCAVLQASKLPVTVHFHGYDASIHDVIKACDNYDAVFKLAKNVIAVSKVMYTKLVALGCPKNKLFYNVYGPQPIFENVQPSFVKKQFIAAGRFTDKKAPYYTILAFNQVLVKHPDATLVLAGDGELYNTCKNLINHFKLQKSIALLGVINAVRFVNLLSESLAFVQHSVTAENGDMEGTPVAVLEASAAGLPIISTYHAGIPDVIIHNKTGLLCDEHDVETMSANMLQVLDDVDFAKQLGQAGKLHIKADFSLERHINTLQNILSGLTSNH